MLIIMWIVFLMLFAINFYKVNSIACYECKADQNSCNEGECEGVSCVKMENSNMDDNRKSVIKSCSMEYEDTQCKQSGFGNKLITRCTCETNFCNEDKNLYALGLQTHSSTNKITLTMQSFLIMTIILIFYINKFL